MGDVIVIDESEPGGQWRYGCPNGHTDWIKRDGMIQCRSCPHPKIPGRVSYDVVLDLKTGQQIAVDEVRVR
ncbi:hypothetical protein ACFPM1_07920 [Halorubrum rubrum]|uniref:DUF951 domain-containing protein n=1 Tax=Halorubrum rubrum TaxID=1126240 RepID=A0ABD5R1N0_9EURY|nr:hypothetical protein [Halorubrum rubrum]